MEKIIGPTTECVWFRHIILDPCDGITTYTLIGPHIMLLSTSNKALGLGPDESNEIINFQTLAVDKNNKKVLN